MPKPMCNTPGCSNICRFNSAVPLCESCAKWMSRHDGSDPSQRPGLHRKPDCKQPNCEKATRCRGWCRGHYDRWMRGGTPGSTHGSITRQVKLGAQGGTDECIIAAGATGRAHTLLRGVGMSASRAAWIIAYGDPGELHVLHRCNGGSGENGCVNVRHLYLGTPWRNQQDAVVSDRVPFGERHGRATLTEDDIRAIRGAHSSGSATGVMLALRYGVHKTHISRIAHRKAWRRVA